MTTPRSSKYSAASDRRPAWRRSAATSGFTLVELLVVVAVIALLIAMLLPNLRQARLQARVVRVHADLRQITTALDAYMYDNRERVPPTRSACGTTVNFQLPIELAEDRYLPHSKSHIPQAEFPDFFQPSRTYRYRAPGAIWLNGSFFDKKSPRSFVWVPDDFPRCSSTSGTYSYARPDDPPSKVTYAVWSIGPQPEAPIFPRVSGFDVVDEAQFPLRGNCWYRPKLRAGLITHFRDRQGIQLTSP